jgi:predicted enzyme related to lactoylglutathione lyase
MPERQTIPGVPCWIDLSSTDPDKSKAFYGALFGWTAEDTDPEYGGYINFLRDGQPVAGCMKNDGSSGMSDQWSIYLLTDDAQAVADAAASNGGQVMVPPMEVGPQGTMVFVIDPGGAAIGGWQPGEHHGFSVVGETGAPGWFELHTREYGASVEFYRKVFGWDTYTQGDTDEFRYTTLGEGDTQSAGIMDATMWRPEGSAGEWSVYLSVDDTDAALAKIVELGGAIVEPAEDTPYGRLARATDATGASFKLVSDMKLT